MSLISLQETWNKIIKMSKDYPYFNTLEIYSDSSKYIHHSIPPITHTNTTNNFAFENFVKHIGWELWFLTYISKYRCRISQAFWRFQAPYNKLKHQKGAFFWFWNMLFRKSQTKYCNESKWTVWWHKYKYCPATPTFNI